MEQDDWLDDPVNEETTEERSLSIFRSILLKLPVRVTEMDIKDAEQALQKIADGLNDAKKNMLTEEDILGVANIKVFSPSPTNGPNNQEPAAENDPWDIHEELDYEESIDGMGSSGSRVPSPEPAFLSRVKPENEDEAEVIYLSSDTEQEDTKDGMLVVDTRERPCPSRPCRDTENVSKTDFGRKLSDEKPFLKMRKSKMNVSTPKLGLTYPLGVTFDSKVNSWFITNQPFQKLAAAGTNQFGGESKIVKIYVGKDQNEAKYEDIVHELIENPTAITVFREGHEIAVLCSKGNKKPSIVIVNLHNYEDVHCYCSFTDYHMDFNYPTRGLARSKGGNLMTMDRPFIGSPRLRLFARDPRQHQKVIPKTFELPDAAVPCFIAASDDKVVITDLGNRQTVLLCKLNDSDIRHVQFERLKIITTAGVDFRAEEMLNTPYFIFVAGAQIDKNGNIIVADAKNHHFKFFKPSMGFNHRISTDFPVPYVSSFHVNKYGEVLILSTRETQKIHFAKMTSSNRLEPHVKSGAGKRPGLVAPLSSKRLRIEEPD